MPSFLEDLVEVVLNGSRADEELSADFRVRPTLSGEPGDLSLLRHGRPSVAAPDDPERRERRDQLGQERLPHRDQRGEDQRRATQDGRCRPAGRPIGHPGRRDRGERFRGRRRSRRPTRTPRSPTASSRGRVTARVSRRRATTMMEPRGIEPLTSCLQSRNEHRSNTGNSRPRRGIGPNGCARMCSDVGGYGHQKRSGAQ